MNPHQKNKVDISKLSPDEARLFRLYGKLPNKKDLLQNKLKERKYFDSGDYALSKAGKASDSGVTQVGREHPNPDKIPHIAPATPNGQPIPVLNGQEKAGSPVKEGTFLHRETSLNRETTAEDLEKEENQEGQGPQHTQPTAEIQEAHPVQEIQNPQETPIDNTIKV